MKHAKYTPLFSKIEGLQEIIKNNKLTSKQKKCIEFIYNNYNNNDHTIEKKELRKQFKASRDLIKAKVLKEKSLKLTKKLLASKEYKSSKTIFCYISFNNEIDTTEILNVSLKDKKRLCVPVIKNEKMIACEVENLIDVKQNKYGILEPKIIKEVDKKEIDLTVVPGIIFNSLGYRVGYGGGFYDAFLKDYENISIALVLKEFIYDKFIPQPFDLPVKKLLDV